MTADRRLPTTNKKSSAMILICLITLVAFILRIYRLDYFSLRGDESFTVIFVQRTWEGLWKGISTIEPNPPLMYLALRVWIVIAGASEFVTRYFSLWFGVLCVPLAYRLAREMRELGGTRGTVGIIAAGLVAINPYQIWHSQDVRNYTMWPALSLLALIFFWRWLNLEVGSWKLEVGASRDKRKLISNVQRPTPNIHLSLYVLATLASLYTHYYDVFILAALNVFVFALALRGRSWKTLARWISAQIVLVALYAPWVLFGTNRITTYGEGSAEQSVSILDMFSRTISAFVLSETVPDTLRQIAWLPLLIVVIAILIVVARKNHWHAMFFSLYLIVPTLALYVISIGRPLFLERYLNGIAPAYYLVLAIGLAALWQWRSRWRVPMLALSILFFTASSAFAISNFQFDPTYAKAPDWRGLMRNITPQLGDIVVQNFTEMSPLYYLGTTTPLTTLPKDYWYTPTDEKRLQQLNSQYRRIWFIPAAPDQWDSDHLVEKFLTRNDERIGEMKAGTLRVQLYLTPREFESKIIPVNARVGDATLTGYRVENGRTSHVVLYWRATQKIAKDYTVFVHIADSSGSVIAQQDRVPAFG
ncbi:MAG: hypothetical protein HZB51_32195, partial [Chloroflexi bacterium]|nr:hypothetical protein [Chloroflexota bacterium]